MQNAIRSSEKNTFRYSEFESSLKNISYLAFIFFKLAYNLLRVTTKNVLLD